MSKRILVAVVLCALVLLVASPCAFAQIVKTKDGVIRITVKGTIKHMPALGGYYIMGKTPPGEYQIANPDEAVLEKWMKSGKTVSIKGTMPGTEMIVIEKINGKKYAGKVSK